MTGSGEPIPLGRSLSHTRPTCIAVRSTGTAPVINSPCPFSDLHLCASRAKPAQFALDRCSDLRGSSQPLAVVRVVDQPKARRLFKPSRGVADGLLDPWPFDRLLKLSRDKIPRKASIGLSWGLGAAFNRMLSRANL